MFAAEKTLTAALQGFLALKSDVFDVVTISRRIAGGMFVSEMCSKYVHTASLVGYLIVDKDKAI